ncbi:MAG: TIGR00341 family protein, partial [Prevotellamassilia sp.]|nr:TIGR00341 family protein [Prevotellamassilia sp.]
NELTQSGTQIISSEILEDSLWLNVVAVGKEISESKITEAEKRLANYGLKDYRLHLIQGTRSDSLLQLSHQLTQATSSRENREKQVLELNARVSELTSQLADYTRLERLTSEIRGELAAVFPQVRTVALSKAVQAQRDTTATTSFVSAMVGLSKGKRLSSEERLKLKEWLRARCKADSLVLCVME